MVAVWGTIYRLVYTAIFPSRRGKAVLAMGYCLVGVLLGRSTSWGRDYFPDEPRILFRTISVLLIAALVLPVLFSAVLRKEIVRRLRDVPLPLWLFAVTACSYLISDTVEHHRLLSPIFLHNARYTDLIEELYEVPFMIGLFMVTVGFMQQDKQYECTALGMTPYHAK